MGRVLGLGLTSAALHGASSVMGVKCLAVFAGVMPMRFCWLPLSPVDRWHRAFVQSLERLRARSPEPPPHKKGLRLISTSSRDFS